MPFPDGTRAIVRDKSNWYFGKEVTLRDGKEFPEYNCTVYIAELQGKGAVTTFAIREKLVEVVK